MDALSPAGLVGALVGLIVGWVNYRIVVGVVEASLRRLDRSATPAEKADFERRIVVMRWLLFAATVLAIPVFGYLVGRTLAG